MKRGRDISHLHLSVNVGNKVKLKRYMWICEVCKREYIAREDAKDCESLHHMWRGAPPQVRNSLHLLRRQLEIAWQQAKTLLEAPSR